MPSVQIGTAATARETQVAGQFVRLNAATKILLQNTEALEQRLSTILRASMPSPSSGETRLNKEALVHHAEQMSNFAEVVENANGRLQEILDRLEL